MLISHTSKALDGVVYNLSPTAAFKKEYVNGIKLTRQSWKLGPTLRWAGGSQQTNSQLSLSKPSWVHTWICVVYWYVGLQPRWLHVNLSRSYDNDWQKETI